MEILTCYEYEDKETLEKITDIALSPFRYLLNGKTIQLIDGHFEKEWTAEKTWGKTALAVASFAVTIITGAFLYSAIARWALPSITVLPPVITPEPVAEVEEKTEEPPTPIEPVTVPVVEIDDNALEGLSAFPAIDAQANLDPRWLNIMDMLNQLGNYPSPDEFIRVIHEVDNYFQNRWVPGYSLEEMDVVLKEPVTILCQCKDTDLKIRNAMYREIMRHQTIPLIESIFALRFLAGMQHGIVVQKIEPSSAGMLFHRLSDMNKDLMIKLMKPENFGRSIVPDKPEQTRWHDIYTHMTDAEQAKYIPQLEMIGGKVVAKK